MFVLFGLCSFVLFELFRFALVLKGGVLLAFLCRCLLCFCVCALVGFIGLTCVVVLWLIVLYIYCFL